MLLLLLLPGMALLAGCQGWRPLAQQHGLASQLVTGEPYRHRVLLNRAGSMARQSLQRNAVTWHVYIEGDGNAVTGHGRPSQDPSPRKPLLLPLLAADPEPALYLGRPCYFDTGDTLCNPAIWTLQRYSQATVTSLASTLLQQIQPGDNLILIGHSGGGTLAVLLAPRLPQTRAVITLAGNLDVAAWTSAHDYTPLPDSLDPARQPPLPATVAQWHLAGGRDIQIKHQWIQSFVDQQPNARLILLEQADHRSPWADWFPSWLARQQKAGAFR